MGLDGSEGMASSKVSSFSMPNLLGTTLVVLDLWEWKWMIGKGGCG